MNTFSASTLLIAFCTFIEIYCEDEDNMVYTFDGIEKPPSVEKYFNIDFKDLKNKEGSNSVIIMNGNVEQLDEFNDEWKSEIIVYRRDTKDGDFTEYMKFPKVGLCLCMKTIYKKYFYPTLKDCSNLPPPDTCPLPKEKYWIKCEFNANVFKHASKAGYYKITANLLKDDEVKTGVILRGSVSEK